MKGSFLSEKIAFNGEYRHVHKMPHDVILCQKLMMSCFDLILSALFSTHPFFVIFFITKRQFLFRLCSSGSTGIGSFWTVRPGQCVRVEVFFNLMIWNLFKESPFSQFLCKRVNGKQLNTVLDDKILCTFSD